MTLYVPPHRRANHRAVITSTTDQFVLKIGSSPQQHQRSTDQATSTSTSTPKRIFCYGDSLTAGTSPPSLKVFPYGIHLENELNRLMLPPSSSPSPSTESETAAAVMVRWRGLPGWTASTMVDRMDDSAVGLQSKLNDIRNPSLSLVIILAGTNDIGSLTSSMIRNRGESETVDENLAVDPILRLHKACLEGERDAGMKDMHTIAVGIPGSAWQEMNPNASKLCTDINGALQTFASSQDGVSYVDFPFPYRRGDSKWSGDGLHLSPEGYETLGRRMAPCVKQILDRG